MLLKSSLEAKRALRSALCNFEGTFIGTTPRGVLKPLVDRPELCLSTTGSNLIDSSTDSNFQSSKTRGKSSKKAQQKLTRRQTQTWSVDSGPQWTTVGD